MGDMVEDAVRVRPGRPRSERSRTAVLRVTSELINEVGLRAMTTDEIASRSGVSKATIYKHSSTRRSPCSCVRTLSALDANWCGRYWTAVSRGGS
jgi:hypothetical protein